MTLRFRTLFGTSLIVLGALFWILSQADNTQAGLTPPTEWSGMSSTPTSTPVSEKRVFLPLITKASRDLSWFIPVELAGFALPMTASFGATEPLDGQVIPGGYAGREWLDEPNRRFVLAMITSWLTPQTAAQQLSLLKPAHASPAAVGEEGYIGETADTDGDPAFRLLVFRRGSYLVLAGSGVLDHTATPSAVQTIMQLGLEIDTLLGGAAASTTLPTAPIRDNPGQPSAASHSGDRYPVDGQTVIVGECLPVGADLAALRAAGALASSTSVTGTLKLGDGTVNGEITLRFDVTDLGPGQDCPICQVQGNPTHCHLLEVRVYVTKIALQAEDGDGAGRGEGDIMVGGVVNVHFNCNGVRTGSISFVTGELGDIGPNGSLQLEKFLGTVAGCQCPTSSPTTTFDLLVRDNDDGDAADMIQVVEAAVVKSQTNDETVKRLDGLKDLAKNKGQDTAGPDPFGELRKRSGDDVGEAHRSDPAPIGR